MKEQAEGPKLKRVSFVVETDNCDVIADEPIRAKVGDQDFGSISAPHGYGGRRFDETGAEMPRPEAIRDGDWRVIGWVKSGGYGHFVQASLAQGYIPDALSGVLEAGMFEIEIRGERRGGGGYY